MIKTILISIALLISAGCTSFKQETGNLSLALVDGFRSYGAVIPEDMPQRSIQTSWKIKTDSEGFIVQFPSDKFPDVDAFLRELYGTPQIWTDRSDSGNPFGVFGVKQIGVCIQYFGGNDAGLVCVKPQNWTQRKQNK